MADTDETTPADVLVFGSINVDMVMPGGRA